MRVLHRPTIVRTAALSASLTLALYALVSVLAPTIVDLSGAGRARTVTLLAGIAVRVLAGRLAARGTWAAGADLPLVLASVAVGGVAGWLAFPGLISIVGVLAGDVGAAVGRLLIDLVLWLVCLEVGAVSARWELPTRRTRSGSRSTGCRPWAAPG